MKKLILLGILIAHFTICSSQPVYAGAPALPTLFSTSGPKQEPEVIDPEVANYFKDKHFLFVGGFCQEIISKVSNYFGSFIEIAENYGATTSYFGLPSYVSMEKNAITLIRHVRWLAYQTGRKIVIVGHSMGGGIVLLSVIKRPQVMLGGERVVDRVIIVQAAVGGSPVACARNPNARFYQRIIMWINSLIFGEGMDSLAPENATEIFRRAFKRLKRKVTPEQYEDMNRRILSVCSSTDEVGWGLWFLLLWSTHQWKEGDLHDGLVKLDAQTHPKLIGPKLNIPTDHLELTFDGFLARILSRISKSERKKHVHEVYSTSYRGAEGGN